MANTMNGNTNSAWKNVKPFAQKNKRWLTALGVIGVGAIAVSVIGTDKVGKWLSQASDVLNEQGKRLGSNYQHAIKSFVG